jgi:hypothetical protein
VSVAEKLVSMKLTAKEQEKSSPVVEATKDDGPRYPYGLELHLDHEAMNKLDMKLPKVGKELMLVAKVSVTSVSSYENVGQDSRSSVSLQITSMCLEPVPKGDPADALYES